MILFMGLYYSYYCNHLPCKLLKASKTSPGHHPFWNRRHLGTVEGMGGWPWWPATWPASWPSQRAQFEVHRGARAQRAAARNHGLWRADVGGGASFPHRLMVWSPPMVIVVSFCFVDQVFFEVFSLTDLSNGRMKQTNVVKRITGCFWGDGMWSEQLYGIGFSTLLQYTGVGGLIRLESCNFFAIAGWFWSVWMVKHSWYMSNLRFSDCYLSECYRMFPEAAAYPLVI